MIVKSLFLLVHTKNIGRLIKFYNFFPHSCGPSSNVCYTDISSLQNEEYISEKEKQFELTEKGKAVLKGIDMKEETNLFLHILIQNAIDILTDVRKNPSV